MRSLFTFVWGVVFFLAGMILLLSLLPDGDKSARAVAAQNAGKYYGIPLILGSFALAWVLGKLRILPGTRERFVSAEPTVYGAGPFGDGSAAPPPERGGLWWAWTLSTAPVRFVGLFLFISLIPGLGLLWKMPKLADDNDVDLSLLTLRALDEYKAATPFLPLGYHPEVEAIFVNLRPDTDLVDESLHLLTLNYYTIRARGVKSVVMPGGEVKQTASYANGKTVTVTSTTPHLTVERAELAKARRAVRQLFPYKKERTQVLEWGESLFRASWMRQSGSSVVRRPTTEPAVGSEAEHYWMAWKVLRGDGAAADEELPRLTELFDEAFPQPEDRAAALAWARGWFARRAQDFQVYQQHAKDSLVGLTPSENDWRRSPYVHSQIIQYKRVLPPANDWSYRWLVYRYFGLTEASRAAARQVWLRQFPVDAEARVLTYGEKILEQRREANDPLPPVPQTLPLVCAVERLVGSDPYGQKCRDLLARACPSDKSRLDLSLTTATLNPNDDLAYLQATPDALELCPATSDSLRQRCLNLLSYGGVIAFVALSLSTVLTWFVRPLIIQGGAVALWEKHEASRGKEPLWQTALGIVVAAGLAAATAPLSLPDAVSLQVSSQLDLFLGALAATILGGLLIATCRRLFALILVACRVDIEATWLDEVLGILAGGFILHHFGAEWLSIATAVLADVLPGVGACVLARLRRKEDVVPDLPVVASARRGTATRRSRPGSGLQPVLWK